MTVHRIRKGLQLPIGEALTGPVAPPCAVTRVAVLADDFHGLRPRMHVAEGDLVRRGQLLFEDRRVQGVRHTAPGAGKIVGIHRGARRALRSVEIHLSDAERAGDDDAVEHAPFSFGATEEDLPRDKVVARLVESGLWTALRTRPFGKVPSPAAAPEALFVTAIDTEPLAPDPQLVVTEARVDFQRGLRALCTLSEGPTFLCVAAGSSVADVDAPVRVEQFAGPHPAGLPGLHIHRLWPVRRGTQVWYVGYQDVIAVGRLLRRGRLDPERIVSLAGPGVLSPRLVRTRLGACLEDLLAEQTVAGDVRLISGSVLSGKAATQGVFRFLGRYDRQVSVLREGRERELLGWLTPGRRRFSVLPVFLSRLLGGPVEFSTSTHGSQRAIVPIGVYERVMPMDILPTHLLRALLVEDLERAEALGCLELEEEDLALCTFVDPGKHDFGVALRRNLEQLEHSG